MHGKCKQVLLVYQYSVKLDEVQHTSLLDTNYVRNDQIFIILFRRETVE